jgi:hypothetical protein
MRTPVQSLVLLVIALGITNPVQAHEGHDHGAPPAPVSTNVAPRAEASSADFEIVAVARGDALEITLDTFRLNEPVESAAIEVDTPSGLLKPKHRGGGIYTVAAPFLRAPGKYDLAFTIAAGDKADVLTASLNVPKKDAVQPPQPATGASSGTGISFPYGIGGIVAAIGAAFLAGIGAARLLRRRGTAAAAVLAFTAFLTTPEARAQSAEAALIDASPTPQARDVAQRLPDGAVFVPKTTQRILAIRTLFTAEEAHARSIELPGRIIPSPNASGLVQASIGGRLSPPEGGFKPLGAIVKAGDILAYVRPPLPSADATVQAQQARELDQQISIVTRKVERLSAIQQVIAKSQLEDAQLELTGLKERRANLDRVNRDPEPLVAPVDGVIAAANAIAGQMAEPSSIIFQIVDPAKLWVEALAFEPQGLTNEASARLSNGRQIALVYLGTGLADRNQAVPVHFAIQGAARGLRTGQFLTVFAKTSEERKGIALPRSAVLRGTNGQAVVYEHTNAERFVPREVRTVGLDGERVLVISGLETAKRVVTQGAELLDQIR